MAFKGAIEVDTQKCKGCSVCIENCPTKSIQLSKSVNNKGLSYHLTAQRKNWMQHSKRTRELCLVRQLRTRH